jgi:membrane peptidoglycan carboxypeptidase
MALAKRMGITTWDQSPDHYGLSITLGGAEVRLLDLTSAYGVFADRGVRHPPIAWREVKDIYGHVYAKFDDAHPNPGQQVLSPQVAYLITSVLSDDSAREIEFGTGSGLVLSRPAAAKTGTTDSYRDNWTVGYTPNLTVGVWVGNADNTPMQDVIGITGAGPIWHDFMEWAHSYLNLPIENFSVPPGIVMARVSSSGYLASQSTAWPITDLFAAGAVPHQYDAGYGDNYTRYRILPYNFSVDGGTLDNTFSGPVSLSPSVSGTPNPGAPPPQITPLAGANGSTNGSVPSGFSGTLPQRPSNNANLCGGRYYTYYPVTVNGQLVWRYTCH